MIESIKFCKKIGIKEIVTGVLTENNETNIKQLKFIATACNPMKITFHKAIDETDNSIQEIKKLKQIPQIKSILSSGKSITAIEGKEMLKKMLQHCSPEINLIVAGRVTKDNLKTVHSLIGATEYHGRKIL